VLAALGCDKGEFKKTNSRDEGELPADWANIKKRESVRRKRAHLGSENMRKLIDREKRR